jgi:hypothetical protein
VRACDSDGQCSFDNVAAGQACSDADDADAKVCSGTGDCVACAVASDCDLVLESCLNGECVPANCSDGVQNGDESDVDCGGVCRGCAIGMGCDVPADCVSNLCDTSGAAGGSAGGGGAGGMGGAGGGGLPPAAGICVGQAQGQACGGPGACVAGLSCADGFCCDGPCSGTCESCAAADTGGSNGVCSPWSTGGLGKAMACSPYVCNGSATTCATSCMNNPDCAPGFTCTMMTCQ